VKVFIGLVLSAYDETSRLCQSLEQCGSLVCRSRFALGQCSGAILISMQLEG
jgi:hypothetical protein